MKHIELMREYMRLVEVGEKEPWKHFEMKTLGALEWIDLKPGHWFFDEFFEYRLKPKTININGFKIPEPVSGPLTNGTKYYIASPGYSFKYAEYTWNGDRLDRLYLERGIIHLTDEAAIKHAEALLSFTKEATNDD